MVAFEMMRSWPGRDARYFYSAAVLLESEQGYAVRVMMDTRAAMAFETHDLEDWLRRDMVKEMYSAELEALARLGKLAPARYDIVPSTVFFINEPERDQVQPGDIVITGVREKLHRLGLSRSLW